MGYFTIVNKKTKEKQQIYCEGIKNEEETFACMVGREVVGEFDKDKFYYKPTPYWNQ